MVYPSAEHMGREGMEHSEMILRIMLGASKTEC